MSCGPPRSPAYTPRTKLVERITHELVFTKIATLLGLLAVAGANTPVAAQKAPVVAAASDLQFAVKDIAAQFKADTNQEVRLSVGSSGNFFRQLQQVTSELFMSADEAYVFQLADAGLTTDRGAVYAEGRIVLFAPKNSVLKVDAKFEGLRAALNEGRISKFAIANPDHAPYGRAAEQALRNQGLWDTVKPKLVLGENVSQAAQFAARAADGGIIAYSLVTSPILADLGSYVLVPSDWHAPLLQRMVLMKGASETAQAFFQYLQTAPARAIFRKYGFILPGESS